ncbi:MAG: DUF1573 domain-containing protein [Planctomycetes bacterium]|nr:DUF1573 domain-containing protein [Planctomycetota bacterium]
MLSAKGFVQSGHSRFREEIAMLRTTFLSTTFLTWALFGTSLLGHVSAQEWAEKMFNDLDHDFGTVARGADTVFRFEITNLYKQPMHITGVRSSCGCTSPTVENSTIKTHEKGYVVAKFNTRTFVGRHGATLTISFAPPYAAEVQVRVHGNIRSDVVFQPGAVQFGSVDEGAMNEQLISVNYAGRENWTIVDVTNDNNHFEVELQETFRGGGKVSYGLLVRLKDNMPPGYVKDQLTVITNDHRAESQRIPLYVEGRIVPEISVTPAIWVLGNVTTDKAITKKVVVRGKTPFKITSVDCSDDCFTFKTDDQSKQLHLVEITFRPGPTRGAVKVPVRISTDRGNNRGATLMVSAHVKQAAPVARSSTSAVVESAKVAGAASK